MILNTISRLRRPSPLLSHRFSTFMDNIKTATPAKPYPGFTPLLIPHSTQKTLIIPDPALNLKFLVEQPGFPTQGDLAIGIHLGSQDQSPSNSGSLKYLQEIMYSKPSLQETVEEYDFLQRSGSQLAMTFDPSATYIKMSFLPEDIDIMSDMILDVALSEKNMYEEGVVVADNLNKIEDLTRYIAFQGRGVGSPIEGAGISLRNDEFVGFQQNITPGNTIFSIAGFYNYEKVIEMMREKIVRKYPKFLKRAPFVRKPSRYYGGFHAFDHNEGYFECAIVYETVPYKSPEYQLFNILKKVVGKAESFSSGGPGKGMYARSYTHMLDKLSYVLMANTIQESYDTTGLFGLTVGGAAKDSKQLVETCVKELKLLRDHIGPQELGRAKHILLSEIYTNIQRQPERLEELTKQIFFFGRIRIEEFEDQIMAVTPGKIKEVLTRVMETPPTIVYYGDKKSVGRAPAEAAVRQLLKS